MSFEPQSVDPSGLERRTKQVAAHYSRQGPSIHIFRGPTNTAQPLLPTQTSETDDRTQGDYWRHRGHSASTCRATVSTAHFVYCGPGRGERGSGHGPQRSLPTHRLQVGDGRPRIAVLLPHPLMETPPHHPPCPPFALPDLALALAPRSPRRLRRRPLRRLAPGLGPHPICSSSSAVPDVPPIGLSGCPARKVVLSASRNPPILP